MTIAICVHCVKSQHGIHFRVAGKISKLAENYSGQIFIELVKGNKRVNAQNMLALISLGVKFGDDIKIDINGKDKIKTIEEIKNLLSSEMFSCAGL